MTKKGGILMDEDSFVLKIVKSLLCMLAVVIIVVQGIFWLVSLAFNNMSVEQSNTWIILCMCMGVIFAIFFCTFTILGELKKKS
jgi:hypothetical protein